MSFSSYLPEAVAIYGADFEAHHRLFRNGHALQSDPRRHVIHVNEVGTVILRLVCRLAFLVRCLSVRESQRIIRKPLVLLPYRIACDTAYNICISIIELINANRLPCYDAPTNEEGSGAAIILGHVDRSDQGIEVWVSVYDFVRHMSAIVWLLMVALDNTSHWHINASPTLVFPYKIGQVSA